jgi:hypothetical protein
MVAPGRWEVEPPATPHRSPRSYASVPVAIVGAMRPVIRGTVLSETWHGKKIRALTVVPGRKS